MGKVWHDPNAAEVVKISTGQLYLLRPVSVRSERECIYNDAMATIRRAPHLEHNFQLVITRVYEEGDQELLEDEDETDEERAFLISEELEFRTDQHEGEPTLIWRDLEGDVDEVYEFVATGTNEPTRAFFETCMYRAMYERKYKKSADNTQDDDLQEFIWHPPVKKGKARKAKSPSSDLENSMSSAMRALSVSSPDGDSSPPVAKPLNRPPAYEALVEEPAELFIWNLSEAAFLPFEDNNVSAAIVHYNADPPFAFHLLVVGPSGEALLSHRVSRDMNQRFSQAIRSFTWNYVDERGSPMSWCLRVESAEGMNAFMLSFAKATWETSNHQPWGKIKSDEQAYVLSSEVEDVEMADPEDEEEDEEDVEAELDPDNADDEEVEEYGEDEDEDEGEDNLPQALAKGERNSQLTVGYKGDRSYVVRGNNIGVFNHSADSQVKYQATISKLKTPKGKDFTPGKVMLHDQDTKMIMMNPSDPHSLFSMDIELGKIVEEWKVHDDVPVAHIAPESKFAQTTREQTVVGASHNALFRIDPRVSGAKMIDSQFKQYATKQKFSGVSTTAAGKLAVCSEKGEIRLFDAIGKNAKTALPPLGDPILGLDVTADGRWVVATTKTYLLLIDTLIGEGRYAGSLGFDRSFPATAKPIPKRLQLRGEHVAYMGQEIAFTPARFNMGEGQQENAIVTATGPFVIAWDFAKVKRGQLDKYEIKKYEDLVVQDDFKFGDDKQIIVALQNNVLAVNKKNLKRPTRTSLAPPRQSLSRSGIVNSPY